ncbi:MAG: AMP-binding protein [Mycobacterium sp.]
MAPPEHRGTLVLSKSQQNIYNGVLQNSDPELYLIGRRYRCDHVELQHFLEALRATIRQTPVQLCVLQAGDDYPVLVPRLEPDDLISVVAQGAQRIFPDNLQHTWMGGIFDIPLARYTVWTDEACRAVVVFDVHCHHLLIDGAGTGIVESTLGRYLAAGTAGETDSVDLGIDALRRAHRYEDNKTDQARDRLEDTVRAELTTQAREGFGYGLGSDRASILVSKGVLHESFSVVGDTYTELLALGERENIPLNVLVATAAVAVDASTRQNTDALLVHAVDNRFGNPDLNVATCLVNSVAHAVTFLPFASVSEVARTVDRGYVKALRRRWMREEHYRRMFLAINRTSQIEALTLNFLPEPCAPDLRPFLTGPPVTTDIGPIESLTVAAVVDDLQRSLTIAVWNRADSGTSTGVARRVAGVLTSMPTMWDQPLATTVGEWLELSQDGSVMPRDRPPGPVNPGAPAWFVDATADVDRWVNSRRYVRPWLAWLVDNEIPPGDVVVLTDDDTDATIDLLVACHLAGCAYSVCSSVDQLAARASAIGQASVCGVHTVEVAVLLRQLALGADADEIIDRRRHLVAQDIGLAGSTAYVMPTSGSTGEPKLVPVTHGALALFCDAARGAYRWGRGDVILQCAPLTSDISIEEVFVAAYCGSTVIRSTATKSGDLHALSRDIAVHAPTVLDLPTAIWHLLCDDLDVAGSADTQSVRQIIIGGEAIRPVAVGKWLESGAETPVSVVSTYGPTETTVVVTVLPVVSKGRATDPGAELRLGRPLVPHSVFVAFGEIVVLGDLVSPGYLGMSDGAFGLVKGIDGKGIRAFATADRISIDEQGLPCFAGRKDAVVKIAGVRVDIAQLSALISAVPEICDVAVEADNGPLSVWFETRQTRTGRDDETTAITIRRILAGARVPSFVVLGVSSISRRPNGKVDSGGLRALPQYQLSAREDDETAELGVTLAQLWSTQLGRPVQSTTSLLEAGIGSVDLIRILPETRRHLGRYVTILDLISADSAAGLLEGQFDHAWMDRQTIERVGQDISELMGRSPVVSAARKSSGAGPIVILGASGVLGTGFGNVVAELATAGMLDSEVILVTRSVLPDARPWAALRQLAGVRVEVLPNGLPLEDITEFVRRMDAGTVINCIGNANMVVPYEDLYVPNIELVSALVDTCVGIGARLVHLSTYSIADDVMAPRVLDPRHAPYPYAASKALAELIVARSAPSLDYTMVRLPRVLPGDEQLGTSADVLVSVVDACRALNARPIGDVSEEVTTADAAARSIMQFLSHGFGRGINVLRGETVDYTELLSRVTTTELNVDEWKQLLDASGWSQRNSRRWSVIDGWITLGQRIGNRTYAEYLAQYPILDLDVRSVAEIATSLGPIADVLCPEQSLDRRRLHGRHFTSEE